MPPESPGNLIVLDLEWKNSRLECQVERYDDGSNFLYVSWNAIECPERYVPLSGGAAYVWVPQGYTYRRYRARVNDIDHGFEWRDVAQVLGAMLILILPPNYVFVSPWEEAPDRFPVDFKSTEDSRMAFYWWLQGGRFAVQWHMEYRQGADMDAECKRLRDVRRREPPVVSPVHIDRPPEEVKVPSHQPPIINEPPAWHNHLVIQIGDNLMGDKINIEGDAIGAAVGSHARQKARDITVYKQAVDQSLTLDEDLKRVLKEAREALERENLSETDKGDAADDLDKLADELQKPEKDVSRVRRLWTHIKDIAPTVASVLSSAASLTKMLGGG